MTVSEQSERQCFLNRLVKVDSASCRGNEQGPLSRPPDRSVLARCGRFPLRGIFQMHPIASTGKPGAVFCSRRALDTIPAFFTRLYDALSRIRSCNCDCFHRTRINTETALRAFRRIDYGLVVAHLSHSLDIHPRRPHSPRILLDLLMLPFFSPPCFVSIQR